MTRGSSATSTARLARVCARPFGRSSAILRRALPTALIGLAATLLALGVVTLAGGGVTALEWSVYDRWLRARASAPVSPALLIVARDAASEARFGAGAWDSSVLARVVTSRARAGAVAVCAVCPLGAASARGSGCCGCDAHHDPAIG